MIKSLKYILIALPVIGWMSCGNKSEVIPDNRLYGTWNLESAMRDASATTTLEGTIITIQDSILITNMLGEEIEAAYSKEGNKLMAEEPFPYTLSINFLSADTLVLTGKMRGYRMKFDFLKADQEPDPATLHDGHSHGDNPEEEEATEL